MQIIIYNISKRECTTIIYFAIYNFRDIAFNNLKIYYCIFKNFQIEISIKNVLKK